MNANRRLVDHPTALLEGTKTWKLSRHLRLSSIVEPCPFFSRMTSRSDVDSMLAVLDADLAAYKKRKAAELDREQGPRDLVLRALDTDLARAQAAIIELSSGKFHSAVSASVSPSSLVQRGICFQQLQLGCPSSWHLPELLLLS